MSDIVTDAIRVAPPLAVTGVTILGATLQEWVYIVTIIYTIVQIALSINGYIQKRKANAGQR